MADDISYASYLRLGELLDQQRRITGEHDELLFIVVHQTYELWFKLVLHELEAARSCLEDDRPAEATRLFRRVNEIMKILVAQFDVLETMLPADFLKFRDALKPASGFQSAQFREVEILGGLGDDRYLAAFRGKPLLMERLARRAAEPTLWHAFLDLLKGRGMPCRDGAELRATLHRIEKGEAGSDLRALTDAMIAFDEALALWRIRHLLMVSRMIGARPGTGRKTLAAIKAAGYAVEKDGGIDYLQSTVGKRCFPLLWENRTTLSL